mgnify:CR=1 FL=1
MRKFKSTIGTKPQKSTSKKATSSTSKGRFPTHSEFIICRHVAKKFNVHYKMITVSQQRGSVLLVTAWYQNEKFEIRVKKHSDYWSVKSKVGEDNTKSAVEPTCLNQAMFALRRVLKKDPKMIK